MSEKLKIMQEPLTPDAKEKVANSLEIHWGSMSLPRSLKDNQLPEQQSLCCGGCLRCCNESE